MWALRPQSSHYLMTTIVSGKILRFAAFLLDSEMEWTKKQTYERKITLDGSLNKMWCTEKKGKYRSRKKQSNYKTNKNDIV